MIKKDRPVRKLFFLLKDLDAWATSFGETKYNPLDGSLQNYSHWPEIAATFIEFLKTQPVSNWKDDDCATVKSAVMLDWGAHRLLQDLSERELQELLIPDYPDDAIRMYMLVQVRSIKTQAIRNRLALHFFENDRSSAVRDSAFKMLAGERWERTNHYAKIWWDSGDLVQRIVALNCLEASKSSLLKSYLEKALESGDKTLRSVAAAIAVI